MDGPGDEALWIPDEAAGIVEQTLRLHVVYVTQGLLQHGLLSTRLQVVECLMGSILIVLIEVAIRQIAK